MPEKSESKAIVVRSNVTPQADYREYREFLRYDFWYSCGYCSISEIEGSGIGFEIDHYYPKEKYQRLVNDYNNLMWSCGKCNRYKSNYDPDVNDVEKGNVVLRPDKDDPREHIELEGHSLIGKTHTGEFNIELLELNRLQLRRLREIRQRFWEARNYIAFGIQEVLSVKIDEVHPERRVTFLKVIRVVRERKERIGKSVDSLLRNFARSPYLDEDPDKEERLKKRKEYLKKEKAIIVY